MLRNSQQVLAREDLSDDDYQTYHKAKSMPLERAVAEDKDSLLDSDSDCETNFDSSDLLGMEQEWPPAYYKGYESNRFSESIDDASNISMPYAFDSMSQVSSATPTLVQEYSHVDLKEHLLPTFGGRQGQLEVGADFPGYDPNKIIFSYKELVRLNKSFTSFFKCLDLEDQTPEQTGCCQTSPYFYVRQPNMRYGYRSHTNMTATRCLKSMCIGVHNETMNVLTHSVPAIYFLLQLNALWQGYAPYDELNEFSSRFFLCLAAVSIIFCLTSSAIYHTFYPMGQLSYDRLLRVDLMGIGVMIFGLTLSTAYAAFHNFEQQRRFVCTITGTLMISNLLIQMTPCYAEDRYHFHRIMMFVGTILISTGLVVYMRVFIATPDEVDVVYKQVFAALGYLVIGFFFYYTRFPDCLLTPVFGTGKRYKSYRKWIQLLCPSHSLWHIGVAANGYGLFWAIFAFHKHVEFHASHPGLHD